VTQNHDTCFERLISGLRAGEEAAAAEFFERYGPLMESLATGHLASGMLRRVGPEDVVQSACRTFLRRVRGGEFEVKARDSLWNLLCAITLAKVRNQVRYHQAGKREVGREVRPRVHDGQTTVEVPGGGPTPAEAAAFADQFRPLLDELDEEERRIVLLKLEERTNDEVAKALGSSERTVRRILKRIESRLADAFE
jgi:RNA polymerase sigma-70 factor, ECF subfamily